MNHCLFDHYRFIVCATLMSAFAIIFSFNVLSHKEDAAMTFVNEKTIPFLFPKTTQDIIKKVDDARAKLEADIKKIINTPAQNRTFATIAQAMDSAVTNFAEKAAIIEVLFYLSPDEKIRQVAHEQGIRMRQDATDLVEQNKELYETLKAYIETTMSNEQLTPEQRYFLQETMRDFKQEGLELPEEKRVELRALKKELTQLTSEFEKNINDAANFVAVSKEELEGLDQNFIDSLKRDDKGLYILGVDFPTYTKVMQNAKNPTVRKRMYQEYYNRAYPANYALLKKIIALRDSIAHLVGYESYAALSLDSTMAKTVDTAENFLKDLLTKAKPKAYSEFQELTKELPTGITLTPDGKLYPWDFEFVVNQYKKNKFGIDEEQIKEYFPVDYTLTALLDIYQKFFALQFTEEPITGLWHPDVRLIKVTQGNTLIGYILLDLYPRPGKYSHAAKLGIIQGQKTNDELKPGLALIMANFPPATATLPSLFKRRDVETFFHEFGHAIHALLGSTALSSQGGTHVKTDFVELPSQMLEEWLWDKDILKRVSKHYKTGESLPDALIDTLIAQKRFMSGNYVMTQGRYATLSLACYLPGAEKDIQNIHEQLCTTLWPFIFFDPNNHLPASFGHLTGYGPKYYGYLWSKVFALDLFDSIKKQGLLNPEIGTKYAHIVLAAGGSKDPNELLITFLGRAPTQDAFLKDLGLN